MVKVAFSVLSLFYPFLVLPVLRFFGENYLGNLLKLYPLFINLALLVSFGVSLFNPPTKVFSIAFLTDSSIRNSVHLPDIENYCRKVTKVWCTFFALNASVSFATALYSPDWIWALYNGLIAYILMGIIFTVEWFVRKRVKKD